MKILTKLLYGDENNKKVRSDFRKRFSNSTILQILPYIFFLGLHLFFYISFGFISGFSKESLKGMEPPMSASKDIQILNRKFNAKQKIKELWKKDLVTFKDKNANFGKKENENENMNLLDYFKEHLDRFNLDITTQEFTIRGQDLGRKTKTDQTGYNFFTIIEPKRALSRECVLLTFDYRNSFEVTAVASLIDFFMTNQKSIIPLGLMIAGLDSDYKHFGYNINKFLDYIESENFENPKCSMIRKGISISALQRKGPQSIVISPYGINSISTDLWIIFPLLTSIEKSNNLQKLKSVKFVEDNVGYYKKVLRRINYYVIRNLNYFLREVLKLEGVTIPRLTNETMFVSIFKSIFGNIHETHSYLLERGIKSLSLKMYLNQDSQGMSTFTEDLVRIMWINYRILTREELFVFHNNGNYLMYDDDLITENTFKVKFMQASVYPLLICLSIELTALGLTSYKIFATVLSRNLFLAFNLTIVYQFPYFVDWLMKQPLGSNYGALCVYETAVFEEGLYLLLASVVLYLAVMYLSGWVIERMLYQIPREDSVERRRFEICISKFMLFGASVFFCSSGPGICFITFMGILINLVPIKNLRGFKLLVFLFVLTIISGTIYILEPERVFNVFKKSIRFAACNGSSHFFGVAVVYGGLFLNCFYVQLKYLFIA